MKKTRAAPAPKTSQEQAAVSDVEAIVSGVHGNPFSVLGMQESAASSSRAASSRMPKP